MRILISISEASCSQFALAPFPHFSTTLIIFHKTSNTDRGTLEILTHLAFVKCHQNAVLEATKIRQQLKPEPLHQKMSVRMVKGKAVQP